MTPSHGSFCAVGIGIRAPAQTTTEAVARIRRAGKVFSLLADPFAEYWISGLNATVETLADLYAVGKERYQTYGEMVERIVGEVRSGTDVCAVSYGHPGIAAFPLHEAVRRTRADGYRAEMLPAVSSLDCLFAELGVDPIAGGCQSFEATDFLVHGRRVDPACNLVLWQIGAIAEPSFKPTGDLWNPRGLEILIHTLLTVYPATHEVVVYESARLPLCSSIVERVALADVPQVRVTPLSTLFVPPAAKPTVEESMLNKLGLRSCHLSGAPSS